MKHTRILIRHLAALAWLVPLAAGCCGPGDCAPGYCGGETVGWQAPSMCHGYYPTCWRPWPEECPPCPPPVDPLPFAAEPLKPPLPGELPLTLPGETPRLEAEPPMPMPMPMEVPEPSLEPPAAPPPPPPPGNSSRRHWIQGGYVSQAGE